MPQAWAAPATATIGGDENGPKVQIMAPGYQDVLKGRTRIMVGVKATQFNPASIQLFLDDKPASKVLSLSSLPSSAFDWDTRQLSDGAHKLSVRVTDTQGFKGWAEVNVYVNNNNVRDTQAPTLKWGNVDAFQQLSGQSQVTLEAKDNFGVKWIIVSLNPLDKAKQQPAEHSWLLARPPYTFSLDTTKVADGLYALSARAWDSEDQEGQSKTLTVGVVNSAVNATTIGQTLESLKATEDAQNKSLGTSAAPSAPVVTTPSKPNFVPPTPKVAPDGHSGSGKAATAPKAPSKPKTVVPEGYTLDPETSATTTGKAPATTAKTPVFTGDQDVKAPVEDTTGTLVAKAATPAPVPAALSQSAKKDVLAPASGGSSASTETEEAHSPVLMARAATPQAKPRTQSQSATLSALNAEVADALAPARTPEASVPTTSHVEFGRAAQPVAQVRQIELAPVLSAPKTSVANVLLAAPRIVPRVATAPKRVAAKPLAPTFPTQVSGIAKVTLSNPTAPKAQAKTNAGTNRKVAALPRMEKPVEVVPQGTVEHPSITVSPVQASFDASLPAFHQVRSAASLRTIAAQYGLPVELVAAANNWRADKRVLPGTIVQLPRQVQISYNGAKIEGDATSLLAGDTTFTAMRFLFEHTGGKITWDAAKKEVVATKGGSTIHVKIGSKVATVNNQQVMMQIAAFLFEGRTMVPTRFFEEGLSAHVQWNPDNGNIVVAMAG